MVTNQARSPRSADDTLEETRDFLQQTSDLRSSGLVPFDCTVNLCLTMDSRCWTFLATLPLIVLSGAPPPQVCYGPLGCFTNEPPFTSPTRNRPLLPEARDVIGVTYSLFLRHQAADSSPNTDFQSVDIDGPHTLSYNARNNRKWRHLLRPTRPTKIIIHDFGDTSTNAWVLNLVEKLLWNDNCHVITVGWSSPEGVGRYYQATANARVVAAEVALLLKNIKASITNFEFEFVHLIGHGIGAHIASHVGEILKIDDEQCLAQRRLEQKAEEGGGNWWRLPKWMRSTRKTSSKPLPECPKIPTIGQITGLDPAGLWYENAGSGARLDAGDATFVEVLHTNIDKQRTGNFEHGISAASGNIDFYPNGGYSQPGCSEGETGLENLEYPSSTRPRQTMDCNHLRAITYYLSSLDADSCDMTSFPCSSWEDFRGAKCTSCLNDLESGKGTGYVSGWLTYLGLMRGTNPTSAHTCLKIGPSTAEFWREHKRRAAATGSDVHNLKAYLKTGTTSPYCLKYARVELELNEPSSEGTLSFRFGDQANHRTGSIPVGRVSNWGSTTSPVYLVTFPNNFENISEVDVLWEIGVTKSWWPGIGGLRSDNTRREIKLPLNRINIMRPPMRKISTFCSNRKRLRSRREQRFTHCSTDHDDPATDDEDEQ